AHHQLMGRHCQTLRLAAGPFPLLWGVNAWESKGLALEWWTLAVRGRSAVLLSANVGDTVRITCSGSSSSYYGWYQQKVPGTGPVALIYLHNKETSETLGHPFAILRILSGSTGTLTITGVQAEDEAVYFCGGQDSNYVGVMKMTHF
uniref:Ig-like domain-containing protein n=1 Tax=Malurus cyaneus samueli TaxID=2593467 RepID=A0A8C5TGL8_9PASS